MSEDMTDATTIMIRTILDIAIRNIVSAVGVVTNVLNMLILSSLGLKHSMSVGLFSLSFTDFLITGFQMASGVCYTIDLLYPTNPIDLWSVGYFIFGFLVGATYTVSCGITAMISVERCVCVVCPFKVKQIFTRHRCIVYVLLIYLVVCLCHIPIYLTHRMEWAEKIPPAQRDNSTAPPVYNFIVIFSYQAPLIELIFDYTFGVGVLFIGQIIIMVCAVWMGYSLESSSRVRHNIPDQITTLSSDKHQSNSPNPPSTLSKRERRLVKVVLHLGLILTVSNIPKIVTISVYHAVPGMDTASLEHVSTSLWAISSTIASLCCSANFFVYVKLNQNFRRHFYQMCGLKYEQL